MGHFTIGYFTIFHLYVYEENDYKLIGELPLLSIR